MRIALFSDIHGNSIALDAVLQDIQKQGGVDAYWILGDLVAIGPDPVGVLDRLTSLENTRFIRGNGDRYGVKPDTSEDDLRNLFKGCNADLVCVGHTHRPSDRKIDNLRIVNVGSLSNPTTTDVRASYSLLDVNSTGHQLKHYKVDYDYKAFFAQCEQVKHPATEFIKGHFTR